MFGSTSRIFRAFAVLILWPLIALVIACSGFAGSRWGIRWQLWVTLAWALGTALLVTIVLGLLLASSVDRRRRRRDLAGTALAGVVTVGYVLTLADPDYYIVQRQL